MTPPNERVQTPTPEYEPTNYWDRIKNKSYNHRLRNIVPIPIEGNTNRSDTFIKHGSPESYFIKNATFNEDHNQSSTVAFPDCFNFSSSILEVRHDGLTYATYCFNQHGQAIKIETHTEERALLPSPKLSRPWHLDHIRVDRALINIESGEFNIKQP